ncbi:MAG TPA: urease accessory UreF family protein [Steroidobacteraceae bacterium]|jgi:urease accessory protein|nr:urease accessory UreF family protein [Steroidobacteraceae bacterium]
MSRPRTSRTHIITTEAAAPDAHASLQLLRLLHLASPALPIGAFHFSQGLEYAVEVGWVRNEADALDWIAGLAGASLATLDLPVLHRLRTAWGREDRAGVLRWNAFLIASRETEELRLEDRHLGSALLRVLVELELVTDLFPAKTAQNSIGVAHATAFAFACARWAINSEAALQTYSWAWVENQVLAAVKLVPLGQSAGQRMLHALNTRLAALCRRAIECEDSDIGISTALSAVASGRHETQYTRLFRS